MFSYLRIRFTHLAKNAISFLVLLSTITIVTVSLISGPSLKISDVESLNFSKRQHNLLYRLKPWCMDREQNPFDTPSLGEMDLESYCACLVGKIDHYLMIDRIDPTTIQYRREHPYFTIELQAFRKRCIEEIK